MKSLITSLTTPAAETSAQQPTDRRGATRNALAWGVFSDLVVLPDENREQFNGFRDELLEQIQPVGAMETTLTDALVANLWRWRRMGQIETGLLDAYKMFEGQKRDISISFANDVANNDALSRLQRYETSFERRTLKLWHELERLQARRAGQFVPAPAVIDLDITSDASTGQS